jgi:hypothetical protein
MNLALLLAAFAAFAVAYALEYILLLLNQAYAIDLRRMLSLPEDRQIMPDRMYVDAAHYAFNAVSTSCIMLFVLSFIF